MPKNPAVAAFVAAASVSLTLASSASGHSILAAAQSAASSEGLKRHSSAATSAAVGPRCDSHGGAPPLDWWRCRSCVAIARATARAAEIARSSVRACRRSYAASEVSYVSPSPACASTSEPLSTPEHDSTPRQPLPPLPAPLGGRIRHPGSITCFGRTTSMQRGLGRSPKWIWKASLASSLSLHCRSRLSEPSCFSREDGVVRGLGDFSELGGGMSAALEEEEGVRTGRGATMPSTPTRATVRPCPAAARLLSESEAVTAATARLRFCGAGLSASSASSSAASNQLGGRRLRLLLPSLPSLPHFPALPRRTPSCGRAETFSSEGTFAPAARTVMTAALSVTRGASAREAGTEWMRGRWEPCGPCCACAGALPFAPQPPPPPPPPLPPLPPLPPPPPLAVSFLVAALAGLALAGVTGAAPCGGLASREGLVLGTLSCCGGSFSSKPSNSCRSFCLAASPPMSFAISTL